MKRLIFSDLHIHPYSYGATTLKNGFNSRIWSQWLALKQIVDYVEEYDITRVYFGGDWYHTPGNLPTQAVHIASDFIWELGELIGPRPLYLLVGNHDRADRKGRIHGLDFLGLTPGKDYKFEERQVFGLNYTEDEDELKKFFDKIDEYKSPCMALLHAGVSGVPMASGYVLDERLTPNMIPGNCRAFSGHYHSYKQVSPRLTVIGSLTAINWNDIDQEKGFLVWDDETDELEFIPTNAPKFITYNSSNTVENCFVRYTEKVKLSDIPDIRGELIKKGALTVEFPVLDERRDTVKFTNTFDLQQMVNELDALKIDPRRKEVGKQLREDNYVL